MEKEVAMIISSLINNIGLLGGDEELVNNTIDGIETIRDEWPTMEEYEKKEMDITCKVLRKTYCNKKKLK